VIRARFTQHARSELLAQVAYYESVSKGLGARFRSAVEEAAQRAAAFPLHGKHAVAGTRRRFIAGFPFSLFYTEAPYGALIDAVAGHRQPPDYWVGRVVDDDTRTP
jgi:plasmid stabilization system protein ParE